MRSRRALTSVAALALAGLSACDSGPDGPGTVSGTVTGPADLGAVVLDVIWAGVQGFEGHGSTQVYSAAVEGEPKHHRVILVGPTGGSLSFGILVDDVYLEGPVVTVVEAVATDNLPRSVGNIRVLLER
jgi:hypothetical protein